MNSLADSFAAIKEPFPESNVRAPSVVTKKPESSVAVQMETCSQHISRVEDPESNPDFRTIKLVSTIVLLFLRKCWMICTTGLFVTFITYWCYGSVLALFLFLCGLGGLFYQISDWLLYHPDEPPHSRLYVPMPSLIGMPFESVFITTDDGVKIHAVFIRQEQPIVSQVPTIMFLHGNAGNIGHRLAFIHGFYKIIRCNILLLEYRGYGHSDGHPSEEGLYLDAQAGLKFLLQVPCIDRSKIVVFGRSLGGAVAIDLASRREFAKHIFVLIAENTFTSIPDVAKEIFKLALIRWMPAWCYKNQQLLLTSPDICRNRDLALPASHFSHNIIQQCYYQPGDLKFYILFHREFNSVKKVAKVTSPALFISGQADNLIPPDMMKRLAAACGSSIKRRQLFTDGTHNDTWMCKGYYKSVNMFLDDVMLLQHGSAQWCQESKS